MADLVDALGRVNLQSVTIGVLIGLGSVFIWRLFLSPIANVPGPTWASLTRLWHMYQIWTGHQNLKILELHEKHGQFIKDWTISRACH